MNRILALSLMAGLLFAGCYVPSPKPGKAETLRKSVELGAAESVEVDISVGVGKLRLGPGTGKLLDAEFKYNIADWKPEVEYEVKDGKGELSVSQPPTVVGMVIPSNVRYEWDLKLSDRVPMDLKVEFGVGKVELDLRRLKLKRLTIEAGVGEGTVDLSGPRDRDLEVEIDAGVGELTLIVPKEVGTQVEVEGGIGSVDAHDLEQKDGVYTNDSWGKSEHSLRIGIEAGVGRVELKLAE